MSTITGSTQLFGGAISVNLPSDYADVSDLRDVPSNQEIYLHKTGLSSIIVEILEYACPPEHPCTTDEEALKYHYADMVSTGYTSARADEEEETKVWNAGEVSIPSFTISRSDNDAARVSKQGARALGLVGTQWPLRQHEYQKTDFTALLTTLVRLPGKGTDILITVSVPHAKGEYDQRDLDLEKGQWGPLIEQGLGIRREIWRSFEVRDWTLFDG